MTDTPIFELTQLESGQDGVEQYNQHLRVMEAMARGVFHDRATTPPAGVNPGETFLVDGTGSGAFAGEDNKIAVTIDGTTGSTATYHFITVTKGMTFFVEDDDAVIYYDGSAWQNLHTGL